MQTNTRRKELDVKALKRASLILSLTILTGLAWAVSPRYDWLSESMTIEKMSPSITNQRMLRISTFRVRAAGARGVIFDEFAEFQIGGKPARAKALVLTWNSDNGVSISAPGYSPVAFGSLSSEDVLRLAVWVARSRAKVVFTLLDKSSADFADAIENQGLSIASSVADYQNEFVSEKVLVPAVLDTPALIKTLAYIDFVESSLNAAEATTLLVNLSSLNPRSPNDSTKEQAHSSLLSKLNGDQKPCKTTGLRSYTNTNLFANTKISIDKSQINSSPMRIFWTQCEGDYLHFTAAKRFLDSTEAASIDFSAIDPAYSQETHRAAMELFVLAAIFEAFKADSPAKFVEFVNNGRDRVSSSP